MSAIVLYQWRSAWGLPSISPACTQIQTYLQLAGIEHSVEEFTSAASSPAGQLPAVEHGSELIGGDAEGTESDDEAARLLLRYLKDRVQDIDAKLSADQGAEVLALTSLVELHLEPASIYTAWCEQHSYSSHTKAAYGEALPFPLNHWSPRQVQKAAQQRFRGRSAAQVYSDAGTAYAGLAKQLQERYEGKSNAVKFFFGEQPSSVDAVLYPHLLFHHRSPVAAPELRSQLERHPILLKYIESVAAATTAIAPSAPPRARGGWSRDGGSADAPRQETAAEKQMKHKGMMWLAAAGAAVVAYVIISGQFVSLDYMYDEEEEEDE